MKVFSISVVFLAFTLTALSQEWVVPDSWKSRLSPFKFDEATRKEGQLLYENNCKICHGTPGKGDFQSSLVPQPADMISDKIQKNLDGELFYKITTGRGQMPGFRNTISAGELWNIISFIRSFKKDYIQAVAPLIRSAAYPGAEIIVTFLAGPGENEITLLAKAVTGLSSVPVTGAGVRIFVKRTFGKMAVDEEKFTDNSGIAVFKMPEGIPGDTAGNLHLSAVFTDEPAFGSASKDTILKAGKSIKPVSLTANRAIWNTVRKAPLWIIFVYSSGVLAVWAFIFLVLFRLRDIYIIGRYVSEKQAASQNQNTNSA